MIDELDGIKIACSFGIGAPDWYIEFDHFQIL